MSDENETPEVDPRIAWLEKAGIDPDQVDPEYAAQGFKYWQSINHRDHADATIEHTLRQRGYIPEGVTLDDVRRFAAEQAEAEHDPYAGLAPQQDPRYGQQEPGYEDPQSGYYDEPAPPPFDPNSLRPVFESQEQRIRAELMREWEERQQRESYEREQRSAMQRLQEEEGLGQTAAIGIIVNANELAATMPTADLSTRVQASLKQFRSEMDSHIAAQAKRQQEANEQAKAIPAGPPPAGRKLPGTLEELLEQERGAA